MGYTTEFQGFLRFDKPLDDKTYHLLYGLATTRRMARNIEGFGVEGEFYIDGSGYKGTDKEDNIINYSRPPATQPGLWCQWIPTQDRTRLKWDGEEKFYHFVEWLEYLIEKVIAPAGYSLNGEVTWEGEEEGDTGIIKVEDNQVIATEL